MDPNLWLSIGVFVATAGAAAVAWWQAIEASKSREDAREAEKAALRSWQEASAALLRANDIGELAARGPYAHALNELATAVMSGRLAGMDEKAVVKLITDRISSLDEKSFSAGDAPTELITKWAIRFAREAPVVVDGRVDLDAWGEGGKLIRRRLRLWMRDPAAAEAEITRDPQIQLDDD